MSDTTIGVSKEAWKLLNGIKEKGDTFDDAVKRMFNYKFGHDELDEYYLKLPFGTINFNCYSIDGERMVLKREKKVGRPFMFSGEVDVTHPRMPIQEIINSVPNKIDLMEDTKFGVIEGTGRMEERSGDHDPMVKVDSRFKILTIQEVDGVDGVDEVGEVEVRDLREEEDFFIEPGDDIKGINKYTLERTVIYGEDDLYKRAVFRCSSGFHQPEESE